MVKKLMLHLMILSVMFFAVGANAMAACPIKKDVNPVRVELFLKFNESQIQQYKAIKAETCGKMTTLKQSFWTEKKKLKELQAKNADPKDIKAQHEAVAKVATEMAQVRQEHLNKLEAILNPAQKAKFLKSKYKITTEGCFCNGNCGCRKGHPCPVS